MIQPKTVPAQDTAIIDFTPLTVLQLSLVANEVVEKICQYRPEFARIAHLQRNAGTRVSELFTPNRWTLDGSLTLQIQPQKGNALRILQLSELGIPSAEEFHNIVIDMGRLPQRQYERAFTDCVREVGLWRLFENGYIRPSTHFLRHVKIKELKNSGKSVEFISTWIGEKNVKNLDYYLNSQYFM